MHLRVETGLGYITQAAPYTMVRSRGSWAIGGGWVRVGGILGRADGAVVNQRNPTWCACVGFCKPWSRPGWCGCLREHSCWDCWWMDGRGAEEYREACALLQTQHTHTHRHTDGAGAQAAAVGQKEPARASSWCGQNTGVPR